MIADFSYVRRRLRTLAILEAVNVGFLPLLLFGPISVTVTGFNIVGVVLIMGVLVQGSGYWFVKLRQLKHKSRLPVGLEWFRRFRSTNVIVLGCCWLAGLVGTFTQPWRNALPGLAFTSFAVLEHVNYFYIQLMHDTSNDVRRLLRRGFRRSSLARDLDRAARLTQCAND
jgi:hypothetical protein